MGIGALRPQFAGASEEVCSSPCRGYSGDLGSGVQVRDLTLSVAAPSHNSAVRELDQRMRSTQSDIDDVLSFAGR
jgi:hypothetical protein